MPTPQELTHAFWDALRSDMTVMAGLVGEEGHMRPLTAQFDDEGNHGETDRGPVWFFTAKDTELAQALAGGARKGSLAFTSKNHALFASVHGEFSLNNDRAVIDRLWNDWVAAWFEGGKDDPKLALLRFQPDHAEIWENESSFWAGIKMMFGADPKEDYRDKVAKVAMR